MVETALSLIDEASTAAALARKDTYNAMIYFE